MKQSTLGQERPAEPKQRPPALVGFWIGSALGVVISVISELSAIRPGDRSDIIMLAVFFAVLAGVLIYGGLGALIGWIVGLVRKGARS